jgi:nitrogen-specific signal transduction histidine kinase
VTAPFVCLLLTRDADFARRLAAALAGLADCRACGTRADLDRWRERTGPAPLLLDLGHAESAETIADAPAEARAAIVAFGLPDSEPYQTCRDAGLFALEPRAGPPERWRQTVRHAAALLALRQERDALRPLAEAGRASAAARPDSDDVAGPPPLYPFTRASRHFDDPQRLFEQVAESVAAASRVARVGVFARLREENAYRLQAGLRCLEGTAALTFAPADPFVRWLDRHAHLVCRAHLSGVAEIGERALLQRVLDALGAEVILPLPCGRGLLGWVFLGHRATGLPFGQRDLADLAAMADHVATLLENALLYEEIAVQKTLAESLLETIPVGIVAVAEDGTVRWFNRAAETILGRAAAETVHQPVERAGSRLADLARRALAGEAPEAPVTWNDPATRRALRASVHRVARGDTRLGAMVLLADVTHERLLCERQEELERHAFWNDLAAALSHEIRNPLVAISTFAQLLPERFAEPDFRQQFHDIVTAEVARLNTIISQINAFAHPAAPSFRALAPQQIVERACSRAARLLPAAERPIACRIDPDLPHLQADETALADGLAHLLVNACEAVRGRPGGRVDLHVSRAGAPDAGRLAFAVSDNGPGVPADLRDRLFSPFGTTKPRGLGLGLPIARRTVVDHGGRIDVDSTPRGATFTMILPLDGGRSNHGETADR